MDAASRHLRMLKVEELQVLKTLQVGEPRISDTEVTWPDRKVLQPFSTL